MKILFAASEVYPIAKTGGLADVAGSLPKSLLDAGHEVRLVMPHYGIVNGKPEPLGSIRVPLGEGNVETASISRTYLDPARRIPVDLLGHQEYFGSRKDLYAFPDDGLRFAFFCKAVVELLRSQGADVDIVHCHDWHTGILPAYLHALAADDPSLRRIRTAFTIHNLNYQGIFGREVFDYTGLPSSMFGMEGLEYYGNLNFLKGGIVYSSRVNTVSPTYSQEIQTSERGDGLSGLLRHHAFKLSGIVNGIDYEVWNPASDGFLPHHYTAGDMAGKARMKRLLQEKARLPLRDDRPIFSFIGRLVDQKGMNILMPNIPEMLRSAQMVILGTGEPFYHKKLQAFHGSDSNLAVFLKYDEEMAHTIYAGSDGLLMPSLFEPCGLGQLIALRYGTIPIVRKTGGLADTVLDADSDPSRGTGFSFVEYTPEALLEALRRAVRAFGDRARWEGLIQHAMAQDFSWSASTRMYENLYRACLQ